MRYSDYFICDTDAGRLINKVSRGRAKKGDTAGSVSLNGYIAVKVCGVDTYVHRIIWQMATGSPPPDQIDHINGDRSDNRLCNLRPANNSENNSNREIQNNNTSGYKGVSLHKKSGLWFAYAAKNGIRFSGGYHADKKSAGESAARLRERLHGDFCNHG